MVSASEVLQVVVLQPQRFQTPGNFQQYSESFSVVTRDNQSSATTIKQTEARDVAVNSLSKPQKPRRRMMPQISSAKARLRNPDLAGSEKTP